MTILRSATVVHPELDRARRVPIALGLFHLQRDVARDLVAGEHVAGPQVVAVGLMVMVQVQEGENACFFSGLELVC